jgi:hypothetical protein
MNTGKITVRTKGIELPVSKSVVVHHLQKNGCDYNIYTVTKNWLDKNINEYWDYKPQFNWND